MAEPPAAGQAPGAGEAVPPAVLDDAAVRGLLGVLNEQLAQLESMPGPVAELALTAVAGLAGIYGQALARTLELADKATVERLLGDELLGHLLALHGIHPEPLQTRLARVVATIHAALQAEGGTAELDGLADSVATVRVTAGGGAARLADVERVVHRAVLTAVPELTDVTVVVTAASIGPAFVSLDALMRSASSARPA